MIVFLFPAFLFLYSFVSSIMIRFPFSLTDFVVNLYQLLTLIASSVMHFKKVFFKQHIQHFSCFYWPSLSAILLATGANHHLPLFLQATSTMFPNLPLKTAIDKLQATSTFIFPDPQVICLYLSLPLSNINCSWLLHPSWDTSFSQLLRHYPLLFSCLLVFTVSFVDLFLSFVSNFGNSQQLSSGPSCVLCIYSLLHISLIRWPI